MINCRYGTSGGIIIFGRNCMIHPSVHGITVSHKYHTYWRTSHVRAWHHNTSFACDRLSDQQFMYLISRLCYHILSPTAFSFSPGFEDCSPASRCHSMSPKMAWELDTKDWTYAKCDDMSISCILFRQRGVHWEGGGTASMLTFVKCHIEGKSAAGNSKNNQFS